MYRTYSPKTFLRQTPNAILKAYFEKKPFTLKGVDFDELGETNIDPIMQAIDDLPPGRQTEVEVDFRAVSEMACAAGTRAILEEAAFHKKYWADAFEAMRNHYERAFWTCLNEPSIFDIAGYFTEMDSLGSWRRRFAGRNLKPAIEKADLAALAKGISVHYAKEGRGHHCKVDNYLRQNPERHCYFVYPEDYATTDMEVDDTGQFQERPRKPTFEIVFVYRPEEGSWRPAHPAGRTRSKR